MGKGVVVGVLTRKPIAQHQQRQMHNTNGRCTTPTADSKLLPEEFRCDCAEEKFTVHPRVAAVANK
jgi:hypothetical protein